MGRSAAGGDTLKTIGPATDGVALFRDVPIGAFFTFMDDADATVAPDYYWRRVSPRKAESETGKSLMIQPVARCRRLYGVRIGWGESDTRAQNNTAAWHVFETPAELRAYLAGVSDGQEWNDYEVLDLENAREVNK